MRVDRIEIVFQSRLVQPAELDRDIVKSSGREPAVEVPQPRNSHANDRNVDVGAGVIENEEIEARAFGHVDAGEHLLARIEMAELRTKVRLPRRVAASASDRDSFPAAAA
jgi:hypothetical protein